MFPLVGAGISGIGGAYHLAKQCPGTRFVVRQGSKASGVIAGMPLLDWIDPNSFNPGSLMRSMHLLPKRGDTPEWEYTQEYWDRKEHDPGDRSGRQRIRLRVTNAAAPMRPRLPARIVRATSPHQHAEAETQVLPRAGLVPTLAAARLSDAVSAVPGRESRRRALL